MRGSLWHAAHNIHSLSWGSVGHWAMFWEHHKDAARLLSLLFPFLAACPFILPSLSQLVHPLSSPPTPHPPACARASWACYPIPTVVAEFVSLTKGPALYTSQRANDSNKQGRRRRGGQAGRCSVELHWVLGRSTSLETREPTIWLFDVWRRFGFDGNFRKTYLEKEKTYCPSSVASRGHRNIQSVQVHCMRVLNGDM